MTSIDWLIAGALGLSALIGIWRGLVRELFALIGWIAAIVAVLIAGSSAAEWLPSGWNAGVRLLVGGSVVFIGVMIATSLSGRLLAGALKAAGLGALDRLLGAVFGVLRGLLVVAVMVFVLGHTPVAGSAGWTGSLLLPYVMAALGWFRDVVPDDAAPLWQV